MKRKPRAIVILTILFVYVLLQFLWWEVLLVRQTGTIISEREKLAALSTPNASSLEAQISELRSKQRKQTIMIVGEGTVFLLLLLFGVNKIRQAYSKEESLNRQQKNFFLSITHELKTPIAATKLQLQTLEKQKLDDGQRTQLVKKALEETNRLNTLIDKVLLASNLESGEFVFRKERADLSRLVTDTCVRYYKTNLDAGDLSLDIDQGVFAEIDPEAFASVITNLVDNALKYSPIPQRVSVSLRSQSRTVQLQVADNGPGVPPAEREQIFRRFYRAGDESTRRSKGTGLGLFIVNYIVRRHGGSVGLKEKPGGGSIFEVKLNG
jgi:two-component system, OmpR family, sensor histidine kinase CiaH